MKDQIKPGLLCLNRCSVGRASVPNAAAHAASSSALRPGSSTSRGGSASGRGGRGGGAGGRRGGRIGRGLSEAAAALLDMGFVDDDADAVRVQPLCVPLLCVPLLFGFQSSCPELRCLGGNVSSCPAQQAPYNNYGCIVGNTYCWTGVSRAAFRMLC